MVLIDFGATHKFISLEVVRKIGLPTTATNNYDVVMGTSESVTGKGMCKGVVLELQGLTIIEDFLPLDLGSTNVVLGMKWLGTSRSIEVNWKLLSMKFQLGDGWMTLKVDKGLNKSRVSLKAMMKTLQNEVREFPFLLSIASLPRSVEFSSWLSRKF